MDRTAASGDAARHARAWMLLVATLAIHVADEALTDFLAFYNPLVLRIRAEWPWFPMPTFAFAPWLAGLILLVIVLALLTPAVRRGERGTVLGAWIFATIMFLNGVGHLGVSAYFGRWISGATTAPLLLAASVYLARCTAATAASRSVGRIRRT